MFSRHPSDRLAAYCDGELSPADTAAIDAHLADCERCRRACTDLQATASALRQLTLTSPPASVWRAIDARLQQPSERRRVARRWELALAGSLILVVATAIMYWQGGGDARGAWQVALQENGQAERTARKAVGDWIETTPASRARIVVGTIGTVDVEPNARVRLGATGSAFRLALERGTISAVISAPPRMFIVDTPATPVIDLGCAYTVTVAPDGATELRMTSGWAALEWQGADTLVPAGAVARTRKGQRPGLPYFEDAPAAWQQVVNEIDASGLTDQRLALVLRDARVRDTLTLWHLLTRTDRDQRVRVYDRMQALVPAPATVTRDDVLRLDAEALRTWREELAWHW